MDISPMKDIFHWEHDINIGLSKKKKNTEGEKRQTK